MRAASITLVTLSFFRPKILPISQSVFPWATSMTQSRWRSERRSEEHTSELQSLMRISYAVFCLKKKKRKPNKCSVIHTFIHDARENTRSPSLTLAVHDTCTLYTIK